MFLPSRRANSGSGRVAGPQSCSETTHLAADAVRIWTRTAVRKQVTSAGTFLSTVCREFCHHLDYERFRFRDSWHTRGFYERAAALYHHARGTAPKRLFWAPTGRGRWRIDWPRTNRGV